MPARRHSRQINSVLIPGDERGLHIHAWKSLFEAAGVAYRNEPSLYDNGPAHNYARHDIGTIYRFRNTRRRNFRRSFGSAKKLSAKMDLTNCGVFARGLGGRSACSRSPRSNRITADSSEVSVELISAWKGKPLHTKVGEIWTEAHAAKQPYMIETAAGPIQEFPDNGGLADYVDAKTMLEVFEKNVEFHPHDPVIRVHYGFSPRDRGSLFATF